MRLAWLCLVFAFLPGEVYAAPNEPTGDEGTVVATVLDQRITADQADELDGLIIGRLLQQYADERGIEVTDGEIETLLYAQFLPGRRGREVYGDALVEDGRT